MVFEGHKTAALAAVFLWVFALLLEGDRFGITRFRGALDALMATPMRKMMASKPPKTFRRFVERYPKLGEAWELLNEGGSEAGPLTAREQRLVKLAIAIGAGRQGAVSAGVRKGMDVGLRRDEIEQAIALAASTIGLPGTVAAFSWAEGVFDVDDKD